MRQLADALFWVAIVITLTMVAASLASIIFLVIINLLQLSNETIRGYL